MKEKLLVSLQNNLALAQNIAKQLKIKNEIIQLQNFPDEESYIRIEFDVKDKVILLLYALDHPNPKILPLIFIAKALRHLKANKIILITPYLPYMRQDKSFKSGEIISAKFFAELLSSYVDTLITIDPHLHRIKTLADIYTIPTITLHATKYIAEWIKQHISSALLIGPDEESEQWVADVAKMANTPLIICKKIRYGNKEVKLTVPEISDTTKTPIIIDDIVSTGGTLCALANILKENHFPKPICITVHALYDQTAQEAISKAGIETIISCNTIPHVSNQIDITHLILEGIKEIK